MPTSAEEARRRTFRTPFKGTPPEELTSGSMLLRALENLTQSVTSFPGNVRQAESEGKNIFDVMVPSLATFPENVRQAEAQGKNLYDVMLGDPLAGLAETAGVPTGGPRAAGPDIFGGLQGVGQDILGGIQGAGQAVAGAMPEVPDTGNLIMRALGLGQGLPTSFGEFVHRATDPYMNFLNTAGHGIMRGLGLEESPAAIREPGFDLQAALAGMTQAPGAIGPGGIGAPAGGGDTTGLNVLSSILGPAAAIPPPVQEPLPPELDLAPIRETFAQSQPAGFPEEDLQALYAANILQGIGQGGVAGAGGPIHEMLLRAGFGGLAGIGAGKGAQVEARAGDRAAQEAFQRELAGFDLEATGAEREAEEARRQTEVRNLERQREAKVQQAAAGASRFLGMTTQGPAFEVSQDGQRTLKVFNQPPTELDRIQALADLTTAQAKLSEAEGEVGGFVDPRLAGLNMHLVQIGDELARTGGYTQAFPSDVLDAIMKEVTAKLETVPAEVRVNDELMNEYFNRTLISTIAQTLRTNPDIIPQLINHSSTAARLTRAGQLVEGLKSSGSS